MFRHNTGKALNASDTKGDLKQYITTSNLYWGRFELEELKEKKLRPYEKTPADRSFDRLLYRAGRGRKQLNKHHKDILLVIWFLGTRDEGDFL